MSLTEKTRLEILTEASVIERATRLLRERGVAGWTIMPAISGKGASGEWTREGQIIEAGRMMVLFSIVETDTAETLAQEMRELLASHMGLVSLSPCRTVGLEA